MERGDSSELIGKSSLDIYREPGPNGEKFDEDLSVECDGVLGKHKIRVVCWSPAIEPFGIVVIAHGLHEHALRYYGVAHELTARGIVVYACDHYAHGKSDGTKGAINDYRVLPDDFTQFTQWARKRHPDLPLSILCHSMGSLITMMAIRNIPDLKSVVFSGIPIVPGPAASSPLGCTCLYPLSRTALAPHITACMAGCMPNGPAAPIDINGITSDPKQRDIIQGDPLRVSGEILNCTAREVIKLLNCCKEEAPHISVPFLCVHGVDDTLALLEGAHWFMDNSGTPPASKQLEAYAGLRHELFHEVSDKSPAIVRMVCEYLSDGTAESLQNSFLGEGKDFGGDLDDAGATSTATDIELTETKKK